jgi:HAMP domain-containing protein
MLTIKEGVPLMLRAVLGLGLLVIVAACSPAALATDVTKRAARTVVLPVLSATTPAPADALATDCVIANATNAELNDLARDLGVRAGTTTTDNIRLILSKPSTQACIAGQGLVQPVV